jgi:hypothetical protein
LGKLKQVDFEDIVEYLREGLSYQTIADKYSISREYVRQIARKNGLAGFGAKKRRDLRNEYYTKKLKETYGQFYDGKQVNKDDLLYVCKLKFTNKKSVVLREGKYEWNLKFGDIDWPTHCPILGLELNYFAEGREECSPSFYRIHNTKGYIPGNVKIVSWRANRIKNDGSLEEHLKIVEYLKNLQHEDS